MANIDYQAFAGNQFNQQVEPLDQTAPGFPAAKTYHGIAMVVNGKVLGRIQSWQNDNAYTRGGNHIFELNNRTFGRPVDYVPGIAEGYTVTASVAELWGSEIEIQTGANERYIDLVSQVRAFTTQEFWLRGAEPYEVWTYLGCWLTNANDASNYTADGGDARVIRNFNFSYVARVRSGGTA